jgi:NAD(P)-dependent dehydrogenase (short-subunit alcohol dehydrogenase family)
MNLQGRVAIVTGSAPSVGRAVCVELGKAGAAVVAIDVDGEGLEQTATEVEFAGGRVEVLVGDVSNELTFADAVALADRSFGRVDILVNHPAMDGPQADFGSYSVADFDRLMAVNVRGAFLGIKHVLPRLIHQASGAVVNFSCPGDLEDDPSAGPYAASSHAVLGLTKAAAREAGPAGVRVNAIRMGPAGHSGSPEEIAEVVRFLVSPWTSANGAVWSLEAGELVS